MHIFYTHAQPNKNRMRIKLTVKPFTFPSNNFLSSRNHEMKLAKIYKSIVFLLHVKTHPDSK